MIIGVKLFMKGEKMNYESAVEKINEYQEQVARTITDDEKRMPLFYLPNWALGLVGELGELYGAVITDAYRKKEYDFEVVVKKEIGDVCWYCAAFCSSAWLGFRLGDLLKNHFPGVSLRIRNVDELLERMLLEAAKLAELTKKAVYHGHHDGVVSAVKSHIFVLWSDITNLADLLNLDMNEILDENIAKLEARYPDGFDVERSKNRVENEG